MANDPFDIVWKKILEGEIDYKNMIDNQIEFSKPLIDFIIKYTNSFENTKKLNVLEVGCGTAIDSYYIAEHTDANCWAIDLSSKSIKLAQNIGKYFDKKIELRIMDATKTDFEDKFFDIIFSQGVIEHFKDPIPLMLEQKRILSDSGFLFIDVPQKYNIYTVFRKFLQIMKKWPYGWERSYSKLQLENLGKKSGMNMIETVGRGITFELSKSKKAYIALLGDVYNNLVRVFDKYCHRYASYYLQDICAVFSKLTEN